MSVVFSSSVNTISDETEIRTTHFVNVSDTVVFDVMPVSA